ncbi:hypothetical protein [Microcoleus sp. CAWBG640]
MVFAFAVDDVFVCATVDKIIASATVAIPENGSYPKASPRLSLPAAK